jgi:2-polyprenyl-3-methyl-5-hydroxy-6-metoxy-1,4-benzoquinol methylase
MSWGAVWVKNSFLEDYSEEHVHFYDEEVPALLRSGLILARELNERPRIVDLGCGDGRSIFALHKRGLLCADDEVLGVDVSERRIERLTRELPFVKGVTSDALNVKELGGASFDYVVCSQLIEHVSDDEMLMLEIRRLLKVGGLAYISSVIKKWYGAYFYLKGGSFRLDPTHVREYSTVNEFLRLVADKGFQIVNVRTQQIMFPLLDLFMRLLVKVGLAEINARFFHRHAALSKARGLRMPVVGFSNVEVLARKLE